MHPATLNLSQTLVLNAMEAIEHWEHWANIVPKGATQSLNKQLIRLSKGLVKAARIFLVERQRETLKGSFQSDAQTKSLSSSRLFSPGNRK